MVDGDVILFAKVCEKKSTLKCQIRIVQWYSTIVFIEIQGFIMHIS